MSQGSIPAQYNFLPKEWAGRGRDNDDDAPATTMNDDDDGEIKEMGVEGFKEFKGLIV